MITLSFKTALLFEVRFVLFPVTFLHLNKIFFFFWILFLVEVVFFSSVFLDSLLG